MAEQRVDVAEAERKVHQQALAKAVEEKAAAQQRTGSEDYKIRTQVRLRAHFSPMISFFKFQNF